MLLYMSYQAGLDIIITNPFNNIMQILFQL